MELTNKQMRPSKEERKQQALEEYEKVHGPAWEEYEKVHGLAWEEYERKLREIDEEVDE